MAESAPAYQSPLPINRDDLIPANPWPEPGEEFVEGNHPTKNPDGVTNSNHDYWPKTQEEKAERLLVEFVDTLEIGIDEPYPEGDPKYDREALLKSIHTPQELVQADDFAEQHEKNLRAGGSVPPEDVFEGNADDADTRRKTAQRRRDDPEKTKRA